MILLTGATGFLGAHLLKFLIQKGEKVKALYRTDESLAQHPILSPQVIEATEWFRADINSADLDTALEGVTSVYHCAAVVSFSTKDKEKMKRVNAEGTANLVNHCLDVPGIRLLHVSSVSTLEGEGIMNEESYPQDRKLLSAYGRSKYRAEMEVWRGSQEGLDMVIINPSVILGAGDWNTGTGKLFNMVWNGLKAYSPGTTGFVSVSDVVECAYQLMNSDISSRRFVLNSENIPYRQLFTSIARFLNKKEPSFQPPRFLANLAWRISSVVDAFGTDGFLSRDSVRSAYRHREYSSERIKQELGFNFKPIDDCIEETCKTFLVQNDKG